MRLITDQQHMITDAIKTVLGDEANVWLFGSRVDDEQKGRDIDLYVEVQSKSADLLQAEMRIYANIIEQLGDQRIDIVMRH